MRLRHLPVTGHSTAHSRPATGSLCAALTVTGPNAFFEETPDSDDPGASK